MMRKWIATIFLSGVANISVADLPPAYCEFGRVSTGEGDFHLLNLYSPTYAVYNEPIGFTAKSSKFLPSDGDHVPFYTENQGRIGEFQVEALSGEGHKDFTLRKIGPVWVWAARNNLCSKDEVFVHLKPTVSVNSLIESNDETSHIEFYLSGEFFPWSRAEVEGLEIKFQVQRKVIAEWRGGYCDVTEEYNEWETVRHLNSSRYYGASNDACELYYRIRSFDGAHYSEWNYQSVRNMRSGPGSGSGGSGSGGSGSSSSGGSCIGSLCTIEP